MKSLFKTKKEAIVKTINYSLFIMSAILFVLGILVAGAAIYKLQFIDRGNHEAL
jgi:hypothetical protein